MRPRTIWADEGRVYLLDQTCLPGEVKVIEIETPGQMWEAIKRLRVRGAPAIGIAAAFGVWLAVRHLREGDSITLQQVVQTTCKYLASARPTAVNLFWALERIRRLVDANGSLPLEDLKTLILAEAQAMIEEDNAVCLAIGRHGADLLRDGDGILTHCNAGGLATASHGTALAVIFHAVEQQAKRIKVFADETRPLLQGARLTAWELRQAGIPVTLICDNMAASVMRRGWVQAVIVGTDRVAANGDFANKIGTYGIAVLARYHNIPFYVAAPMSSIDMAVPNGASIPIEERDADEVTTIGGVRTAPDGVEVFNPAFDVSPADLVTAFITEKGIVYPPYPQGLRSLFD
ncbi:MAG: S-methyl-5-thioribose-1-phosphate isomerase [Candidatus Sumerlaeaceae bacterium]|nr:S-methyl-5-thioribose-1-phosphate isomerase [Candidatus Sumerlaeaceae bacterium]